MSGGTTDYSSVPVTNGPSTWVPTPNVEIWRSPVSDPGTAAIPAGWERIYPVPQPENGREDHG